MIREHPALLRVGAIACHNGGPYRRPSSIGAKMGRVMSRIRTFVLAVLIGIVLGVLLAKLAEKQTNRPGDVQ